MLEAHSLHGRNENFIHKMYLFLRSYSLNIHFSLISIPLFHFIPFLYYFRSLFLDLFFFSLFRAFLNVFTYFCVNFFPLLTDLLIFQFLCDSSSVLIGFGVLQCNVAGQINLSSNASDLFLTRYSI
jgi:hypothetical protein